MPRHRDRRHVPVNRLARQRNQSNVAPGDFVLLWQRLSGKPEAVLTWFQSCGVGCLAELDEWNTFRHHHPEDAAKVILVAATLGIPERLTTVE